MRLDNQKQKPDILEVDNVSAPDFTLSNLYTVVPKFYKVKGRSTNRGTDTKWATVCCGGYSCPSTDGESPYTP